MQRATDPSYRGDIAGEVFARLPLGLVVTDARRNVIRANGAARDLLGPALPARAKRTCCELFGCRAPEGPLRDGCLTELALAASPAMPEMRLELPAGPAWISAAPLGPAAGRVVVTVRPAIPGDRRRQQADWSAEPGLRICALGATVVSGPRGPLDGTWLSQRPGQLLKYLICHCDRSVHVEELAEVFWPETGIGAINTTRHFIHALRDRLEPGRTKGLPSPFVVTRDGGYRLDLQRVSLDVVEFEERVRAGLAAAGNGHDPAELLERAVLLYRGDLLADEPYADWAFSERERLRALAAEALGILAERAVADGDLAKAAGWFERLVEMEPFALDAQRRLIGLCLRRRRHDEALRRYTGLRQRMRRQFGEEPGFTLADLAGG